jgi:very-short-patch-repair endonuclease
MKVDLQKIWEDSDEFGMLHLKTVLLTEFRPQKHKYSCFKELRNKDIKFREFLKEENRSDFRADYAFLNKEAWNARYFDYEEWVDLTNRPWGLVVEIDGSGGRFSHQGAGAERDRRKNIEFLLEGLVTIRFTAQTVRNAPDHVTYDIYRMIRKLQLDSPDFNSKEE